MSRSLVVLAIISLVSASLATAQNNTFPATGDAGIGTTQPRGPLHILRAGAPPGGLPASQNGLLLGIESTTGFKWVQSYGGALTLNPTGNDVGIGRTAPTHRLDIGGAARFRTNPSTNLLVRGDADDAFVDLVKETSTTPAARLEFEGFTDASRHEGEIVFFTRGTADNNVMERMRIGSDGVLTLGGGGQLVVRRAEVSILSPRFRQLRLLSRKPACINELGNTDFNVADCLSTAEYAPTVDGGAGTPDIGDLVSLVADATNSAADPHAPFVVAKSTRPCDPHLLGIISDPATGASGRKMAESYLPLAIYGYFPVKVTVENGAIRRGDPITSSSQPGHGMKATAACRIVGYALEDAGASGVIQVLASLGDYPGAGVKALEARLQALEARLRR